MKYKLTIAYDGTDYYGWQVQKDLPSLAQVMQKTFAKVFDQEITVLGASRTDAGVHALGQIALVKTDLQIPPQRLCFAWNNALPSDIIIRSIQVTTENFHPHHNTISKTYYYHFFTHRPSPFIQRYGWYYIPSIDFEKLKSCLQIFCGTHDFIAYSTGEPIGNNSLCSISTIELEYFKRFGVYRISITGNRFLRHMVRRLVGAALHVASKPEFSVSYLQDIIASRNQNNVLPTAPAKGLLLYKIKYKF